MSAVVKKSSRPHIVERGFVDRQLLLVLPFLLFCPSPNYGEQSRGLMEYTKSMFEPCVCARRKGPYSAPCLPYLAQTLDQGSVKQFNFMRRDSVRTPWRNVDNLWCSYFAVVTV